MKRSTTWAIVGMIWGGGIGFVFGILPAYAIVWGVLEELAIANSGAWLLALFWGACSLFLAVLGAISGYLLGRQTPPQS